MDEAGRQRLRVWTFTDVLATVKYPLWTLWRFLVDFPLAVRNTYVVLSLFVHTSLVGVRAIRVLRRTRNLWSDRTRGRSIWTVSRRFWARWVLDCGQADMEVVGTDLIDWRKPHVIVSNHQSTLDIFPLIAHIPIGRFVC